MVMRVTLLVLLFASSTIGQELIEGKTFEYFAGVSIQLENRQHVTIRRCFFKDVGFTMIGNDLSGGGEFGMDCIHGCENGVVAHNTIRQIDGTGLLIGYGVKNVNVYGNNIIDCGSSFETDGSANDITHQSGIHCRNGVENVLISSNLICRERAEEMRYGIHLRETTGVIKANLIVGVDETIHIPRSLAETVKIE